MEIKTALNNVDFCIFSLDTSFWMQWIGTEQEIDLLQDTTLFCGQTSSSIKKSKITPLYPNSALNASKLQGHNKNLNLLMNSPPFLPCVK